MSKFSKKWIYWLVGIVCVGLIGYNAYSVYDHYHIPVDYTTTQAESALNDKDNLYGKVIDVDILKVKSDKEYGQVIQAGKHLNFFPEAKQSGLKKGKHVKFQVMKAVKYNGSWMIKGRIVTHKQ
ncbi:hypothetical protein [Eupransor demetentiae]|uniref:Uncharacterized protein n=1 Tax=Eupransor demetentiae TaxID=3109584 RepID=A0ABP0EMF6_9LACO|nr:hypothetical protein R54876_GBNLAHCA_00037 [Lactobacillaceae bacterium LMG 33000]